MIYLYFSNAFGTSIASALAQTQLLTQFIQTLVHVLAIMYLQNSLIEGYSGRVVKATPCY